MLFIAPSSSTSNRLHCLVALMMMMMIVPCKAAIRNRRLGDDGIGGGNLSPCNDDETTLNIYIAFTNPDNGEAYNLYDSKRLRPYFEIKENQQRTEETGGYDSFDIYHSDYIPRSETNDGDMDMLPLCVQKETCFSLTVGVNRFEEGVSPDKRYVVPDGDIKFEYDGNIVPWSETSPYPYYSGGTKVNAIVGCDIQCDPETQVLFEIETVTGTDNRPYIDWYVIHSATGDKVIKCLPSIKKIYNEDGLMKTEDSCYWEDKNDYYNDKICLPKMTACDEGYYTLVISDNTDTEKHSWPFEGEDYPHPVNVYYGGERILAVALSSQGEPFSSIDFGHATSCTIDACPDEDDSLMEVFINRYDSVYNTSYQYESGARYPMTWALTNVSDSNGEVLRGGTIVRGMDRALTYHRQCVPKDTCMKFDLSVDMTQHEDEDWYWEHEPLLVLLDGVRYGLSSQFVFGGSYDPQYEMTRYVGKNCNRKDVCGVQFLLDMTMTTGDDLGHHPNIFNTYTCWGLGYNDTSYTSWDAEDGNNFIVTGQTGHDFHCEKKANETYRHITCFEPDDSCVSVYVNSYGVDNGKIADFQFSVNGHHYDEEDAFNYLRYDNFTITHVGTNCPALEEKGPLVSTGAIIAIVKLTLFLGLIFLFLLLLRMNNSTTEVNDETKGLTSDARDVTNGSNVTDDSTDSEGIQDTNGSNVTDDSTDSEGIQDTNGSNVTDDSTDSEGIQENTMLSSQV